MYRRRHGIPAPATAAVAAPPPPPVSRGSLLDAWRTVIGTLPDAEVAALAGCSTANVSLYRRRRGIVSSIAHRTIETAARPRPSVYLVVRDGKQHAVLADNIADARRAGGAQAAVTWLGELL